MQDGGLINYEKCMEKCFADTAGVSVYQPGFNIPGNMGGPMASDHTSSAQFGLCASEMK